MVKRCLNCMILMLGWILIPLQSIAVTYDADLLIISQNQPPVFIQSFCTMPPHPDLEEKLKREGKWEKFIREFPERPAGLDTPEPAKAPVTGVRKAIVLLVDFSDKVATTAQYQYTNLLFSLATYPTGSMRDYYKEVSYSQLDVQGSVVGWGRAPQLYSYYTNGNYGFGSYPHNAQRLTEDTVNLANPYVDFANYDNDGDTYVDALFIVHAGPGAEVTGSVNDIWSHAWQTHSVMTVDGVHVSGYSMEPEDGKIGVFSHELGHVFGLPDLYDYGYDSKGVGYWSLMAGGSWGGGGTKPVHPDAWSKIALGWVTPVVPTINQNNVSFPNVEANKVIYKLWTNGLPVNEYFLAENRQKAGFDVSLPGAGLMLWHVDDNMPNNDNQWYPGLPPANHYKVAVEPADGLWQLEHNTNSGDTGDPFPGSTNNKAFTGTTTPNSDAYLTGPTGVGVTNISPSAATMTANIQVGVALPLPDIKANGSDGTITTPGSVSITIKLDPWGYAGQNADWWHVADTPFGLYRYNVSGNNWVSGSNVSYQGHLFNLSPFNTLNTSLPSGTYTFYFGVDMVMNGVLDFGSLYYDHVVVKVP
ncbi:MAG: M6 family metalloprotease domain-containing protein [Nitrospirota bacterium]